MNVQQEIQDGLAFLLELQANGLIAKCQLIGTASYMPERAEDVDFAVLLSDALTPACEQVGDLIDRQQPLYGFDACGDYDTKLGNWCAVRRGNLNLMLTNSGNFYNDYLKATEVCKALELTNKADRIAVCGIIRDGLKAEQVFTSAGANQQYRKLPVTRFLQTDEEWPVSEAAQNYAKAQTSGNPTDQLKAFEAGSKWTADRALVPADLRKRIILHWRFGQFADDFHQPLAKSIRADIRAMCEILQAMPE